MSPRYTRGMKLTRLFLAAALVAGPALAHDIQKGPIKIIHPWARATVPAQKIGAGYMSIQNTGKDADRLVGASTAVAERVEMHVTTVENNVARMREVKGYDVKPGEFVHLAPGGAHLMLVNLKQPLKAGDSFPIKLRFERAGEVDLPMMIEAGGSTPETKAKHGH